MERKVAFITGICGQDGSYLTEFLLSKGYAVRGIVRRSSNPNTSRLEHILQKHDYSHDSNCPLVIDYGDMTDVSSLRSALEKTQPTEIYNLAAQSHVGISFQNPESTFDINALGSLRLLEAVRDMGLSCRFYQASSSEMFGASPPPQNEMTPFKPQSPYGVSKVAAFNLTRVYREAHHLFASNGILFNHESPRRGINFVTRKITRQLARIIVGEAPNISLGNLDAKRDWGYSKEYVEAMWKILQHTEPDDFVISTGETHTVRDFLDEAFRIVGLNYQDYLKTEDRFLRPAEVPALLGDSSKARTILGWNPQIKFKELTYMMVESDIKEKLIERGLAPVEKEPAQKGFYIDLSQQIIKNKF